MFWSHSVTITGTNNTQATIYHWWKSGWETEVDTMGKSNLLSQRPDILCSEDSLPRAWCCPHQWRVKTTPHQRSPPANLIWIRSQLGSLLRWPLAASSRQLIRTRTPRFILSGTHQINIIIFFKSHEVFILEHNSQLMGSAALSTFCLNNRAKLHIPKAVTPLLVARRKMAGCYSPKIWIAALEYESNPFQGVSRFTWCFCILSAQY